ncbi:sigma 54-interacting transcriptional regulator [Dehalobacter sp. DCM]|uniref:sigma-54 interaction domain-containing protein n=1 Tax=Dehalobacter sp. DCM TaxID=2907827 RepID=UPI003081C372|nr:sigma 54-interacting transcriptional regulator [Dehalobacter sp. DCM]
MLIKSKGLELTDVPEGNHVLDLTAMFSKQYFDQIIRCKEQFFNRGIDPCQSPLLRQEVVESWVRTMNSGKSPDNLLFEYALDESKSDLQGIWEENSLLIRAAGPLIREVLELAANEGYALGLFDKNSVFLIGTHLKLFKNAPAENMRWNEHTAGTTATSLATYYKRPYLLVGPEHYLHVLENIVGYAVPILDENGDLLGSLALTSHMDDSAWEKSIFKTHTQFIVWLNYLVTAIESQIKLQKSNHTLDTVRDDLKKTQEIMNVLMEKTNQGVVAITPDGAIITANQEGKKILHVEYEQLEDRNILEFITDRTFLRKLRDRKDRFDSWEENVKLELDDQPYRVSIWPVRKMNGLWDAAILKFLRISPPKICFDNIIAESKPMTDVINLADRFASASDNILLLGESGTGKELFAQAIHQKYCPAGPFVAINCAAMPKDLIESELFGYESGAFTGADKNGRPGKIELANGGTLFLDEIGDMPYDLQGVLLRVLQDKQVVRIGGKYPLHVNFRLIAATNQNIRQLVQEKAFRQDLYFRLSVLTIEIPALRERGTDIALLAEYFLKRHAQRRGQSVPTLSQGAYRRIMAYDWPGNVRQLENTIIYAMNLADEDRIEENHLPKDIVSALSTETDLRQIRHDDATRHSYIKESERIMIENALVKSGRNVSTAAVLLSMSKATLYRKIKEYGLSTK